MVYAFLSQLETQSLRVLLVAEHEESRAIIECLNIADVFFMSNTMSLKRFGLFQDILESISYCELEGFFDSAFVHERERTQIVISKID